MKNKILSRTALALLLAVTARAQNYNYTTIDDPLGVEGTIANGISGNNIVGHYSDSSGTAHGYEAIPTQEPSTLAMGALGATSAGLLALRRKQKRGQN